MEAKAITQSMRDSSNDNFRLGILATHASHESGAGWVNGLSCENLFELFLGGMAYLRHDSPYSALNQS